MTLRSRRSEWPAVFRRSRSFAFRTREPDFRACPLAAQFDLSWLRPALRSIIALTRTLWLRGYPDQAAERASETVKASEATGHSAALALVLAEAATVALWRGDLDVAQRYVDRSYSLAEANAMGPLMAIGRCRNSELKIRRGAVRQGVYNLKAALRPIYAARHELLTTEFNMELAFGLLELG